MELLIERAKAFAIAAHEACEQVRNYTGAPYWTHPEEVAQIVADVGGTPEMIAAAWLHDVVEDTPVKIGVIHELFGDTVASLVLDLTDVSVPGQGPRSHRRTLDRLHTADISDDGQTIKLADLIANSSTIVAFAPGFARTYLVEKWLSLKVLTRGNAELQQRAAELLESNRNALGMTLADVEEKAKPYLEAEARIREQHQAMTDLVQETESLGLYDSQQKPSTEQQ